MARVPGFIYKHPQFPLWGPTGTEPFSGGMGSLKIVSFCDDTGTLVRMGTHIATARPMYPGPWALQKPWRCYLHAGAHHPLFEVPEIGNPKQPFLFNSPPGSEKNTAGAEATLVSRGMNAPLSPIKTQFPAAWGQR